VALVKSVLTASGAAASWRRDQIQVPDARCAGIFRSNLDAVSDS